MMNRVRADELLSLRKLKPGHLDSAGLAGWDLFDPPVQDASPRPVFTPEQLQRLNIVELGQCGAITKVADDDGQATFCCGCNCGYVGHFQQHLALLVHRDQVEAADAADAAKAAKATEAAEAAEGDESPSGATRAGGDLAEMEVDSSAPVAVTRGVLPPTPPPSPTAKRNVDGELRSDGGQEEESLFSAQELYGGPDQPLTWQEISQRNADRGAQLLELSKVLPAGPLYSPSTLERVYVPIRPRTPGHRQAATESLRRCGRIGVGEEPTEEQLAQAHALNLVAWSPASSVALNTLLKRAYLGDMVMRELAAGRDWRKHWYMINRSTPVYLECWSHLMKRLLHMVQPGKERSRGCGMLLDRDVLLSLSGA